ncbi:gas vesicle protein GvpK [Krasilnikovia cinnamomea]|uniref:Gas vesicle protein GvpK n=1 Tax=Krasilnikovia cinnamomea TaxID=349313 RepID=A0A4V2G7V1_9ACTN|nr:gas vesicle protein K [Krasilnikovia cinnamomea]RZU54006.1 gas vesicle protein GvpK [Krasilnikovia cinnamomea]
MSSTGDGAARLAVEPESVERGLATLVLTVVELLRQLMERQALRRVDEGELSAEQVERLGLTLMTLEEHMVRLCDHFGVTLADLNLDLGPLGPLLGPVDPPRPAADSAPRRH